MRPGLNRLAILHAQTYLDTANNEGGASSLA